MLTKLTVNGFRSLVNFSIDLQPGLNVLVGSNGTGKSNFIAFLDFLSAFVEQGLNNAIGVAQGAGSVFSRELSNDEEAVLKFAVSGSWKKEEDGDPDVIFRRDDKSTSGSYNYSATIKYLRSIPAVFITEESIDAVTDIGPPMRISRTTTRKDQEFVSTFQFAEDSRKHLMNELRYLTRDEPDIPLEDSVAKLISPEASIWRFLAGSSAGTTNAFFDLMSYRSVNIDPTLARLPTPVGSASELEPTGRGLAGALYELKRGRYHAGIQRRTRFWLHRSYSQPEFGSIISWCKEVNPSIRNVEVDLDFSEAQFRAGIEFQFGSKTENFPFARISDGTVKWLTLVTILLAEPGLNIIEEPENFLHPFMQEAFVTLCRQILVANPRRVIVISTHSPTLLDSCQPVELTMFELEDGQSRATKIENETELSEKIQRSRFGLGYYYKTGAVYGASRSPR